MDNKELIKELEELRDIENYSQSELMNTGYKTTKQNENRERIKRFDNRMLNK